MFNLFNKSKVRAGKQTVSGQKPAAGQPAGAKKQAPFAALGKTWAKLNKMDRKQAYTWGSIAVVVLLALITFASAMGGNEEDFSGFETRGYDLANMPFSSDEAEQYLLATKYPDMQNSTLPPGLYSSAEKEARQEEDAQAAAEEQQSWEAEEDSSSGYVPGRYYGGGGGGGGQRAPTQVGALNSASLKTAGGSGVSGTFGPTGDFSNFRSQEKGSDVFVPQQGSAGNARKALFTSAMGSRAAAGQLDNRLANAKKAMLGNVQGSAAFMDDSGAVDLSKAAGLNLDPNAPVSSGDPNAFNDALDQAHDDAGQDAADQDEAEWWQTMLQDLAKQAAQAALSWGFNQATSAIDAARQARLAEQAYTQEWQANNSDLLENYYGKGEYSPELAYDDANFAEEMGLEVRGNSLYKGDTLVGQRISVTNPQTGTTTTSFHPAPGQETISLSKGQAANINDANFSDVLNLPENKDTLAEFTAGKKMAGIDAKRSSIGKSSENKFTFSSDQPNTPQKGTREWQNGELKEFDGSRWISVTQ